MEVYAFALTPLRGIIVNPKLSVFFLTDLCSLGNRVTLHFNLFSDVNINEKDNSAATGIKVYFKRAKGMASDDLHITAGWSTPFSSLYPYMKFRERSIRMYIKRENMIKPRKNNFIFCIRAQCPTILVGLFESF